MESAHNRANGSAGKLLQFCFFHALKNPPTQVEQRHRNSRDKIHFDSPTPPNAHSAEKDARSESHPLLYVFSIGKLTYCRSGGQRRSHRRTRFLLCRCLQLNNNARIPTYTLYSFIDSPVYGTLRDSHYCKLCRGLRLRSWPLQYNISHHSLGCELDWWRFQKGPGAELMCDLYMRTPRESFFFQWRYYGSPHRL